MRRGGALSLTRRLERPRPRAAEYWPSPETRPDPCELALPPQSSSASHTDGKRRGTC